MSKRKLHPIYQLARTNAWIEVSKPLMFAMGNDEALVFGELLSRYCHFEDENELTEDGFFFNTVWDLASGINLNDHQQRKAIGNLVKVGLLEMKVKGQPPRRYFRIPDRPLLFQDVIEFGAEKMRRVKQDKDSQIFKELIFNQVEKHIDNKSQVNNEQDKNEEIEVDPADLTAMRIRYELRNKNEEWAKA